MFRLLDKAESDTCGVVVEVSTVELPMYLSGPAILHGSGRYETCLFWDDGSEVVARYASELEAVQGHVRVMVKVRAGWYDSTIKESLDT